MKVGDKVWVPVEVVGMSCGDAIRVEHDNCGSDFWVVDSDVHAVTAEDYRNALSEFYKMSSMERVKIWGFGFMGSALDTTAEEFVDRLREYRDEPKTGQIWKSSTGEKIVVIKADKNEVYYYRPCGNSSWFSRNYFDDNFRNTGEVLTSIDAFLKDLEGLNEG